MLNYIILALALVVLVGHKKLIPSTPAIIGAAAFAFAMLISVLTWDRSGDLMQFYARMLTGLASLILIGLLIGRRKALA